ncbi:MAG: MraY family glycosyltransferase [Limnothrix sp.]
MPAEFSFLLTFLSALIVVLVSTPIVKALAIKSGRVDEPNERKVHTRPMVRLGGVAIFIGTIIAIGVAYGLGGFQELEQSQVLPLIGVLGGSVAFFTIGLLDDLFELSAISRLVLQFLIAGAAWLLGVRIEYLAIPFGDLFSVGLLSLPMTLVWLVGLVNAINWIDGLDGLAAGVSGIVAMMLFITILLTGSSAIALIAIALAGAVLGFLRYNFNPAQLFMGDGGSYFLGFLVASISVVGLIKNETTATVLLPYLILAVPVIDMTNVVFSRISSGASPFKPDNRHLHHRLLAAGFSQRMAVVFIYVLTIWTGSFALACTGLSNAGLYVAIASIALAAVSWQFWSRRELPKTQESNN